LSRILHTLPTADREQREKYAAKSWKAGKYCISAVFKSGKFCFDVSTSAPASSSRANSPTPRIHGEGTSTQNSPSVSFSASDMQPKSSHHRIQTKDVIETERWINRE
ncbi:hypothetical protein GOODEAATRI_030787, partial [Goodea atripinnis]